MCRYGDYHEAKAWTPSSSYLVIACLHELLFGRDEGLGEEPFDAAYIHGAKIYGIELNEIKAARSCGGIRTARRAAFGALNDARFSPFSIPCRSVLAMRRTVAPSRFLPLAQSRIRTTDISRLTRSVERAKILLPSGALNVKFGKRISDTCILFCETVSPFDIFFYYSPISKCYCIQWDFIRKITFTTWLRKVWQE